MLDDTIFMLHIFNIVINVLRLCLRRMNKLKEQHIIVNRMVVGLEIECRYHYNTVSIIIVIRIYLYHINRKPF